MLRGFQYTFAALTLVFLGAQAMLMLERGDTALLTLGQGLALLYWPDPVGLPKALDRAAAALPLLGRMFAIPALVFGCVGWAALAFMVRRKGVTMP